MSIKVRSSCGEGRRVLVLEAPCNCTVFELKQLLCQQPHFMCSHYSRLLLVFKGLRAPRLRRRASRLRPQAQCCATTRRSATHSARFCPRSALQLRYFSRPLALLFYHLQASAAVPTPKPCRTPCALTQLPLTYPYHTRPSNRHRIRLLHAAPPPPLLLPAPTSSWPSSSRSHPARAHTPPPPHLALVVLGRPSPNCAAWASRGSTSRLACARRTTTRS
jgi:hypothetical protein